MAQNKNFSDRISAKVSEAFVAPTTIGAVPISTLATDFSRSTGENNQPFVTTTQLGQAESRISHELSSDNEYGDYVSPDATAIPEEPGGSTNLANYGKQLTNVIRLTPRFIAEASQGFTEAEAENLNDPVYLKETLAVSLKEALIRKVYGKLWNTIADPLYYGDFLKSSLSGVAADENRNLTYSPLAIMTDYNEFGIRAVSQLHFLLRKHVVQPTYNALVSPALYNGLTSSTVPSTATSENTSRLNWLRFVDNADEMEIPKIKGVAIHETEVLDSLGKVQANGLEWVNKTLPSSVSHRDTRETKANKGTGTTVLGDIFDAEDNADKKVADSMNVIGAVLNKRSLAFASWPQIAAQAVGFSEAQLGTYSKSWLDETTGLNLRLRFYFDPSTHVYRMLLTSKFDFVKVDSQSCALILKD